MTLSMRLNPVKWFHRRNPPPASLRQKAFDLGRKWKQDAIYMNDTKTKNTDLGMLERLSASSESIAMLRCAEELLRLLHNDPSSLDSDL